MSHQILLLRWDSVIGQQDCLLTGIVRAMHNTGNDAVEPPMTPDDQPERSSTWTRAFTRWADCLRILKGGVNRTLVQLSGPASSDAFA